MKEFKQLPAIQQNVLLASIIADGEITKIFPNSRRINQSYREHYGIVQEAYRTWKQSLLPEVLYLTPKSHTLRSASSSLFTQLYPYFYDEHGQKQIPVPLLHYGNMPLFLAILYLDDGSLSISRRINNKKKVIYLIPHIFLYLQNYPLEQLIILQHHIHKQFNIEFSLSKRKDGHGYILRFTTVEKTLQFLDLINDCTTSCTSMRYKLDWTWRLQEEKRKYALTHPNYEILTASRQRQKTYTEKEIDWIISSLKEGKTQQQIADELNRSYWGIVAKIATLRKGRRF